jgi:hypothetical protein
MIVSGAGRFFTLSAKGIAAEKPIVGKPSPIYTLKPNRGRVDRFEST